jgi:hydrogenase expression/formation protein HypC
MCLSFPGKIVEINENLASVDYGQEGVRKNINISLVQANLGNYVIVQGGFAIRLLTEEEAMEILNEWKIIHDLSSEGA